MVNYGGSGLPFPLDKGYGLKCCAVVDPAQAQAVSTLNNNQWHTRVWVPAGVSFSNIAIALRTAGTHDGVSTGNWLAVWDDSGNVLDQSAETPTLWTTAGWRTAALPLGTISNRGNGFVYAGFSVNGFAGTPPTYPFVPNAADSNSVYITGGPGGTTNRRAAYSTSSATAAAFNPTSYGTSTGFLPVIGLY